MIKRKFYYYLGVLLILLGCLGYNLLGLIEISFIIALLGIAIIILSDKKWWLKVLTILLLPPIFFYGYMMLIFALSDEVF